MIFENLNLIDPILKALNEKGYIKPTPIQEQTIPFLLEGKDLLGCAQTGTGKTAAFAIPILQKIYNDKQASRDKLKLKIPTKIKALILSPTRELANQIGDSFSVYGKYTKLKKVVIFGGVSQNPQVDILKALPDILIATPGRLLDLIQQKFINLENIEILVLDEADQMLNMGFIHDIRKIIALLPPKRQNMLFSATMPTEILKLVDQILVEPEKVAITPVSSTVDKVSQHVYFVEKSEKRKLLVHLLKNTDITSAIVYSRTKHGADKITKELSKEGINVQALHGDKSQQLRQTTLNNFKNKTTRVLVATDIAARGIDVNEISHIINFDLPNIPETYVHRIGRTGRAGLGGAAISFCANDEKPYLKGIEKLIGKQIEVIDENPVPKVLNVNFSKSKILEKRNTSNSKSDRSFTRRVLNRNDNKNDSKNDSKKNNPNSNRNNCHGPRKNKNTGSNNGVRLYDPAIII